MTDLSSGDTAWVLAASALVLFMTPGLAFFYGGLVRNKNVLGTIMQSFIVMGLVGVLWVVIGYTLAFGPDVKGWGIIGNLDHFGLKDVGAVGDSQAGPGIPAEAFMIFQAMFAIITPALITGAFAERAKFGPFLLFMAAWSLLVYAPVAHWVFAVDGWIAHDVKGVDFAGGTAIHVNAGAAALAAALMFGRRKGFKEEPMEPHDITMVVLGASILWFGWFGFNAGSAGAASPVAVNAFTVTNTAAAAAALAWTGMAWLLTGKPSVVGAAAGAVAGLVAITPASGYVQPMESIAIGGIAGVLCFLAVQWRTRSSIDDSLDVVAVHGVGGLTGALLTGVFCVAAATTGANALGHGVDGLTHGGGFDQLGRQALGVLAVAPYSFVMTFAILKVLDLVFGIRVSEDDEVAGLDVSQHGERAYIFGGSGPVLGIPEAIPVHTHDGRPATAAEHALQTNPGAAQ
ncbi:MAG TPA: ammonium transporter [Dehalococcoidia bacterium]|nr:ammonium transporter [Dehalococcoidia bacterium]